MGLDVVHPEPGGSPPARPPEAVFYYDLGDPDCYLVAERVRGELPLVCDWEPVDPAALGITPPPPPDPEVLAAAIARQQLLALRLPAGWPVDSALATRVATYAKAAGKSIAFSLAAFRQVFAGGRPLDESTVLLAAAACEMHPTAVLKGATLRATESALARAHRRAADDGVTALPAFTLPDADDAGPQRTVCGPDALDQALRLLGV